MSDCPSAFYSSNEDVSWGPLTLREIRHQLSSNMQPPERRASEPSVIKYGEDSDTFVSDSKYFTPNETCQTEEQPDRNEVFLKELEQCIDGGAEDTLYKIINAKSPGRLSDLDGIQQSLVENTIYLSSEAEETDSRIVIITDSESDFEEEVAQINHHVKTEILHSLEPSYSSLADKTSETSFYSVKNSSEDKDNQITGRKSQLEKSHGGLNASDLSFLTHESEAEEYDRQDKIHEFSQRILQPPSIYPSTVNKSFSSVDDSLNSKFNDTLEEMEMVLKFGLNYDDTSGEHSSSVCGRNNCVQSPTAESPITAPQKPARNHLPPNSKTSAESSFYSMSSTSDRPLSSHSDEKPESLNLCLDASQRGLHLSYLDESKAELNASDLSFLTHESEADENDRQDKIHDFSQRCFQPPATYLSTINESSQYKDTSLDDSSQDLQFNDTLEEMEMVLKYGLNYQMPGEDPQEGSSSVPDSNDYVASPPPQRTEPPVLDNFKVPRTPLKLLAPKSNVPSLVPFKNVVSPVSVYIKNSPGVFLKQNVAAKNLKNVGVKTSPVPMKAPISGKIPQVIYKPPRRVVETIKKDIQLPGNIQKLVKEPIVVHHERRVQNNQSISRKLMEDDLTGNLTNLSIDSHNDMDVSYVTTRQAFIK